MDNKRKVSRFVTDALEDYIDCRTLDLLPDGVVIYYASENAKLLYANDKALQIFECDNLSDMRDVCDCNYLNFLHPEDLENLRRSVRTQRDTSVDYDYHTQYRIYTKKSSIRMLDVTSHAISIPNVGKCIICSITQMDQNIQYSVDSISVDRLTGAMGMGQFIQHCEAILKESSESDDEARYNIAFFNIRHFKEYNVEYGVQKGDIALQSLARIITKWSTTRVIARVTSDQFVAISKASDMDDRIDSVINEFEFEYARYGISLNVGVFPITDLNQDVRSACDYAKIACDSIRNSAESVCVYNEALSKKLALGRYIIQHFDEAIDNRYIKVYYQPVIRTLTGAFCGMEALARWIDPVKGLLSPADFITVLEDNRLITKLDLYVLDTICEELKDAESRGWEMIPVSFNLSRVDFIDADIFAEVEKIIKKYAMPRDLINIEITESMVMSDASLFKDEIERFRNAGYQVWMDDFGNGYSSLNVLNDFNFDEIKMDMKFLSTLDESSKKIISSVVRMAKDLGVQTLAEGVETKEQYEFLREIGCEKVQGYYFGRPAPRDSVRSSVIEMGIPIEEHGWSYYYDQVGKVNFITDRALSICEFDGSDYRIHYVNDSFRTFWDALGIGKLESIYTDVQERSSDFWKKYRKILSSSKKDDDFYDMDYLYNGCSIRIRNQCVSKYRDHILCRVEVANFTKVDAGSDRETIYSVLQGINEMIILFDLEANSVQQISRSAYSPAEPGNGINLRTPEGCVDYAANNYIHPDDRDAYLELCDFSTLKERLKRSSRGFVANYIRTKIVTGAYVWEVHYLVNIPGTEKYIYMSKYAPIRQNGLFERVNRMQYIDLQSESLNPLWESLMESDGINLFWKDKDRRFLGANKGFLDVYGFDSVDQIIGKTDEDMRWHTIEEPFKADEERILRDGISIRNRIGKCIIKGSTYDIVANKEPYYINGEIAGLWGYFTVLEDIIESNDGVSSLNLIDPATGVMSTRGVMPVIIDYIESWNAYREDFAVITINFPRYNKDVNSYGQRNMNLAMTKVGDILKKNVDITGNCATLFGGTFAIYTHYRDKSEVDALIHRIEEDIAAIREVDNIPMNLIPEFDVIYASDSDDMQDLVWLAMLPSVFSNMDEFSTKYHAQSMMKSILDCLPGKVAVFEGDKDGNFRKEYTSKSTEGFLGQAEIGDSKEEIMSHIHPDDRDWVSAKVEESVRKCEGLDITYRVIDEDGSVHWMHHIARAVPQTDEISRFYVIYNDVTEQKEVEEERKSLLTERYGEYLKENFDANDISKLLSVTDFQSSMLTSIANAFISMHILNLEDYSFMKIFCMDYVDVILENFKNGQDALDKIVDVMITPEYQDAARTFFDLATVAKRMRGKNILKFDYSGVETGWCRAQILPVTYDENGSLKEVIMLVQHIQADKEKEENYRKLSEIDGLSQLYNHMAGEHYVNEYLKDGIPGMFCLIDIDMFKSINDTYGHHIGDEVIRGIGRCMKKTFRERDVLIRIGGDEFAVYAPGLLDQSACATRVEMLKKRISELCINELPLSVSISVGTIICDGEQFLDEFDKLYKAADVLMYSDKRDRSEHSGVPLPVELSDEMPTALLIYRADEDEKILFASRGLVELFDCDSINEFMKYTNGTFKNIVHPDDIDRVENEISEQIEQSGDKGLDHVFYRIISAKGRVKYIEDYGHLVDSKYYGHAYFVTLNERSL